MRFLIIVKAGAEPEAAPLHTLGSGQWEKARKRAAQQVRDTAEAFVEFPGERSKPVESEKVSDSTWRVSLGNIGVIEEFGGTYSAPKAPLRRACEATGLELS